MTASHLLMSADGPEVSRIIVGLMRLHEWELTPDELRDWIEACLEMGVTTFDHADIYGSYTNEARFGEALALDESLRERMVLISKCNIMLESDNRPGTYVHHYNTSYNHIIKSAEQSLWNLHTDYLDLLLIHRPDPLMNADEVARALTDLRETDKVRYVGVSNFTPHQFALLQSRLDFPLVTNQVECSVLHLDALHDGTFDQCQQTRIAPMVWSPLAGGAIFNPQTEQEHRVQRALASVGEQLGGATLDQVALAWLMRHPVKMLPVLGTGKIERVRAAVDAEQYKLDRQQWFSIWEASAGHEVP